MLKKIIRILPLLLPLSACKSSLKTDLFNRMDRGCSSNSPSTCTIILEDVTKFKWDKLYLFGSWTRSDSISKMIGSNFDGNDVEDDYRRMLFTYEKRVVYEEDFKSLDSYLSTLNFPGVSDSLHSEKVPCLTPKEAIFLVEKDKYSSGCKECSGYTLIPIKRQMH